MCQSRLRPEEMGPQRPQNFLGPPIQCAHSMRNSNQILRGDQTECEESFYTVDHDTSCCICDDVVRISELFLSADSMITVSVWIAIASSKSRYVSVSVHWGMVVHCFSQHLALADKIRKKCNYAAPAGTILHCFAVCLRFILAHKMRTEARINFKFGGNIRPRACKTTSPIFSHKDQRSWLHGPTDFSYRWCINITNCSGHMSTVGFNTATGWGFPNAAVQQKRAWAF